MLALCAAAQAIVARAQEAPQSTRAATAPPAHVAQVVERARAAQLDDDATRATTSAFGFELLRGSQFGEAAQLFAAILEKRPRDPLALYGVALAEFNTGRHAEAEKHARAAVEVSRAEAERALNQPPAMLQERISRAADALVLLAVILAVKGDASGALATTRQAVALAPEHFDAQFALGRALYGAGDLASAYRAFRVAASLNPRDARARFFLATALERAGDAGGALGAYRELVRDQPQSAEGHLGLGALLVKLGGDHVVEGINELLRAVALGPNIYEARVTLGRALVHAGRVAEAVEHLRRAAELAPSNPEPHYQLAIAYRRLGRWAEAATELKIVKGIHDERRASAGQDSLLGPDKD